MIAFRKQAYFLPCFREHAVSCVLPSPRHGRIVLHGVLCRLPLLWMRRFRSSADGCCMEKRGLDMIFSWEEDSFSCKEAEELLERGRSVGAVVEEGGYLKTDAEVIGRSRQDFRGEIRTSGRCLGKGAYCPRNSFVFSVRFHSCGGIPIAFVPGRRSS